MMPRYPSPMWPVAQSAGLLVVGVVGLALSFFGSSDLVTVFGMCVASVCFGLIMLGLVRLERRRAYLDGALAATAELERETDASNLDREVH